MDIPNLVAGFFLGIISSAAFLSIMVKVKPKIAISEHIAKDTIHGRDDHGVATQRTEYQVKIINKTWRSAIDVKAQLELQVAEIAPGGKQIWRTTRVELCSPLIMEIPKFSKKDHEAEYAYRLVISEDLDKLLPQHQQVRLEFLVSAKDSVSGFSHVFKQTYHPADITPGKFNYGERLDIHKI